MGEATLVIVSFALEFDSRTAMGDTARKLWKEHGVTGEVEMQPLSDGRWRLTVHSEKHIRETTIDGLQGIRVKARTILSKT